MKLSLKTCLTILFPLIFGLIFLTSLAKTAYGCAIGPNTTSVTSGGCQPAVCAPSSGIIQGDITYTDTDPTGAKSTCTQIEYFPNQAQCLSVGTRASNPCSSGCNPVTQTDNATGQSCTCASGNITPTDYCNNNQVGPGPWWCQGFTCGYDCTDPTKSVCVKLSRGQGIGAYPDQGSCQSVCFMGYECNPTSHSCSKVFGGQYKNDLTACNNDPQCACTGCPNPATLCVNQTTVKDTCGSVCPSTLQPNCSVDCDQHAVGTTYTAQNGCGTCSGCKVPPSCGPSGPPYCDKPNLCNGGANYQMAQAIICNGNTTYNTWCDPSQCQVPTCQCNPANYKCGDDISALYPACGPNCGKGLACTAGTTCNPNTGVCSINGGGGGGCGGHTNGESWWSGCDRLFCNNGNVQVIGNRCTCVPLGGDCSGSCCPGLQCTIVTIKYCINTNGSCTWYTKQVRRCVCQPKSCSLDPTTITCGQSVTENLGCNGSCTVIGTRCSSGGSCINTGPGYACALFPPIAVCHPTSGASTLDICSGEYGSPNTARTLLSTQNNDSTGANSQFQRLIIDLYNVSSSGSQSPQQINSPVALDYQGIFSSDLRSSLSGYLQDGQTYNWTTKSYLIWNPAIQSYGSNSGWAFLYDATNPLNSITNINDVCYDTDPSTTFTNIPPSILMSISDPIPSGAGADASGIGSVIMDVYNITTATQVPVPGWTGVNILAGAQGSSCNLPNGGKGVLTNNCSAPTSFATQSNRYKVVITVTDNAGNSSVTTRNFSYTTLCIGPWLQSAQGDVHSNRNVNTPGGPN